MGAALSQAEKWRRHREAFEYAHAHNVTLKEAERLLSHERAQRSHRDYCSKLEVRKAADRAAADRAACGRTMPDDAPWMMRD